METVAAFKSLTKEELEKREQAHWAFRYRQIATRLFLVLFVILGVLSCFVIGLGYLYFNYLELMLLITAGIVVGVVLIHLVLNIVKYIDRKEVRTNEK